MRPLKMTAEKRDLAAKLLASGKSVAEVAKRCKVAPSTVYLWFPGGPRALRKAQERAAAKKARALKRAA